MVQVLKTKLYDAGLETAVSELIEQCAPTSQRQNKCVSATGAHGMITAIKEQDFQQVLDSFYWNLPDGMPGVWVGRLKGSANMNRCYGPDFFMRVFQQSANTPVKHFLCGGKEGVADELKEAVGKKFSNHNVVGTYCPPFRTLSENEFKALGDQINQSGANVVWIGLSTPKQERFAQQLKKYTSVHFIVTVGAAFDFHTDNVKQAPAWMQQMSMEWFFRLLMEPKRLYKRYLEIVPLFIFYNLKEALSVSKSHRVSGAK
ncbi:WecB/TagA/CpsF family glycosyltransferase [Spirosoma taeanense]|uniref:WecB/TagA/CpsF family glycosyltransferase n=1 Tax=Spirosoma taeanense TaxID=2735870 RepID=A0A6M5Y3W6_9BACT|nr:WecB/TagA/CpsF family glycosyltransferase [Spirosoma taeanense]QJW88499.1 WecB/TagA/CpsF family glycosyltransferase [Spirosoma taeanense]